MAPDGCLKMFSGERRGKPAVHVCDAFEMKVGRFEIAVKMKSRIFVGISIVTMIDHFRSALPKVFIR